MLGMLKFWWTCKLGILSLFQNNVQENREQQTTCCCTEEVGEQLNMLSCFSTWSSSELRHIATTHCFHERGKHLTGVISVPVHVAQHRCPLWLRGLTKNSAGVPVYASQGSIHPQGTLNTTAIARDCTSVMWCGSEWADPGSANMWVTTFLQRWPLPLSPR